MENDKQNLPKVPELDSQFISNAFKGINITPTEGAAIIKGLYSLAIEKIYGKNIRPMNLSITEAQHQMILDELEIIVAAHKDQWVSKGSVYMEELKKDAFIKLTRIENEREEEKGKLLEEWQRYYTKKKAEYENDPTLSDISKKELLDDLEAARLRQRQRIKNETLATAYNLNRKE